MIMIFIVWAVLYGLAAIGAGWIFLAMRRSLEPDFGVAGSAFLLAGASCLLAFGIAAFHGMRRRR